MPNDILQTYTNKKYNYSFQYSSEYNLSDSTDATGENYDSPLVFVHSKALENDDISFIVIEKIKRPGYYNARSYDPFTSNIDSLLLTEIGEMKTYSNGEATRLPDETINNNTYSVFSTFDQKRYVLNTDNLIYVVILDKLANEGMLSSFKIIN